ncbi:hypothetical protein MASR2M41_05480 [Flammeovirgaceae bacterium]
MVGKMDLQFESWFEKTNYPNVIYRGYVENSQLVTYLSHFDIAVCSYATQSKTIGIEAKYPAPTKAGDALAAGCILFCSNHPYLRRIIDNNIGFWFDESNLGSVMDEIRQLTRSDIDRMKKGVKSYFNNEFCMDKMTDHLFMNLQES